MLSPFAYRPLHLTGPLTDSIPCRRRKAILLTWTMDAGRVRALFPTFSRNFLPQWRPFGHIACWCNAVFRFLQATLETCSSSQFRASRFIALSLQTISYEITCNYNSSVDKHIQFSSYLFRMRERQCGILSTHTNLGGSKFRKSL